MVGLISSYIEHFTYLGLFVVLMLCGLGLPMPGSTFRAAGRRLPGASRNHPLSDHPDGLAARRGGGDNSLFFIGRHAGTRLLTYFGLGRPGSKGQVARIRVFMERHGHLAIFYARFLAGLRAVVYLTAGSLGVSPSRFLFYDIAGALISVPIVVTLGYLFGGEIEQAIRYIGGFQKLIWIVAGLSTLILRDVLCGSPLGSQELNGF